jgi:hypothetical protein
MQTRGRKELQVREPSRRLWEMQESVKKRNMRQSPPGDAAPLPREDARHLDEFVIGGMRGIFFNFNF